MTETQQQPGTAVARRPAAAVSLGVPIANLDQAMELAKVLAHSSILPDALHGKPGNVLAILLYGQDLGLSAMQAIQAIYVVKGKPQISGQTWIALARKRGHNPFVACKHCPRPPQQHVAGHGHDYEKDHDANHCVFTVIRGDTSDRHTETFTIEDAKTAKLLTNDNWLKYPRRMLMWRAATDCMRVICPEIALGFYAEGDDFTDDAEQIVEVTRSDADEVADAEIVDPEAADAEVADLAAQFNFAPKQQPEPLVEDIPDDYQDENPGHYTEQEIAEMS